MPQSTREGKWVIYHRETGQQFERWPVDAREMIASGAYTAEAPGQANTSAPAAPAHDPSAPLSAAELAALPLASTADVGLATSESKEHSPGVPLAVTAPSQAGLAMPVQLPHPGQRSSGKRR